MVDRTLLRRLGRCSPPEPEVRDRLRQDRHKRSLGSCYRAPGGRARPQPEWSANSAGVPLLAVRVTTERVGGRARRVLLLNAPHIRHCQR